MPTTNGHQVETGCVLDNHFGWHNHARLVGVAASLGFPISDDDQAIVDRYDTGDPDQTTDDDFEIVAGQGGIVDDAINWLNDHTPYECPTCGQPVEMTDSGGWWRHVGLQGDCPVRLMDHARGYLWHWYEGDFMLSPWCGGDDPDCDDDTCAHWSFQ